MLNGEKEQESRTGLVNLERRKSPRFSVNLPIEYWRSETFAGASGQTVDYSEGGLMVYLSEPMNIGQSLRLKLSCPSSHDPNVIEALVQVVWRDIQVGSDRDYRTGVKFLNILPDDLARLKKLLWQN